ncbi:B3 domain-containing protein-like [Iris pallida]|uniref:B3 domain-containing protein-like n=1 Tax=Iris pallida TaxID=29817 RepID=A0AAX6DVG3_IRIPA|nr:B3 domain-containing protein-like [Iris pallida]
MAKSSFFKIFFAEQSSTELRIPPAFREHIEDETHKKVSLKGPSGSRWPVGLVKKAGGLFFEDGWKEFVSDQSLATGDFLVFQYNGHSSFSVMVFDKTACEKKAALSARPSGEDIVDVEEEEGVVVKEEIIEEEEEEKPSIFMGESLIKKRRRRRRRSQSDLNGTKVKRSNLSLSVHLDPDSRALATVCMSQSQPSSSSSKRGRPKKSCGLSSDQFSEAIRKAKSEFRSTQDSTSSLHFCKRSKQPREAWELVRSKKVSCERGDSVKVLRMGCLISQRRPITEEEVNATLQRAMSFKSTNPFALAVMQEAYVYSSFFMSLPAWFACQHLPKENTDMTVWDPNDRSWKITYISYITRGALSGGWGKFSYANNLEKYDVCAFELIKTNHLRVHIFRVVDELKPLLRFRN